MVQLTWEWGKQSTLTHHLPCFLHYPVSGIPHCQWSHRLCHCITHKLLSLKPFKLLWLLSKQAFIFHEAEQGCCYNPLFCWLPPVFGWNGWMSGKCLHVIYMTGRQQDHKCTWLEWYALKTYGHLRDQSGHYRSLVLPLCLLLHQLFKKFFILDAGG